VKALLGYGFCGSLLVALASLVVVRLVPPASGPAIWWAAGLALGIQILAFAALVLARRRGLALLAAWGGGTLFRFAAVLVVAVWAAKSGSLPPAPLLLGLTGFLFVLLMLEPIFLRVGIRGSEGDGPSASAFLRRR